MTERHSIKNVNTEEMTGVCSVCGPIDIKRYDKKKYRCGERHRRTQLAYYAKRDAAKGKYKPLEITYSERIGILKSQNYVCAICKRSITARTAKMDHCHKTGKTRGMLCNNCNMLLGLAKDNVETIDNAIKYLKEYSDSLS